MPELHHIIGDALRHKIHREHDFVSITVDGRHTPPSIAIATRYPGLEVDPNTLIVSRYALGQWLNQPDSQIHDDIAALLRRNMPEGATVPTIDAAMIDAVKHQASCVASHIPPDTKTISHALANDIPAEAEILLRAFPDIGSLSGSIFLVKNTDDFKRGKTTQTSSTGGTFIDEDQATLVSDSAEAHDGCVPHWRATAIHEAIHQIDHILQIEAHGTDGFMSDTIISDAAHEAILDEVDNVQERVMEILEPSDEDDSPERSDFLHTFSRALFPKGIPTLNNDEKDMLAEDLLAMTHSHFHYIDMLNGEAYPEYLFKAEHLAYGMEIVQTLAIELQHVQPHTSRTEAVEHAMDAVALFSPTLVKAVQEYAHQRDTYLEQLRKQQGPLHAQIHFDAIPKGMQVPDPTHANNHAMLQIASRPATIETSDTFAVRGA